MKIVKEKALVEIERDEDKAFEMSVFRSLFPFQVSSFILTKDEFDVPGVPMYTQSLIIPDVISMRIEFVLLLFFNFCFE